MAAGDPLYNASGNPIYSSSGDPLYDDGTGDCSCCGGGSCICCDEYDITFKAGEPAPFGGNTFRVTRVILFGCGSEGGSEWRYDDGMGNTILMFFDSGNTAVAAQIGGVEVTGARFINCVDGGHYTFTDGIPCCPVLDSQIMLGGSGVDTVVCVGGDEDEI